MIHGNRYDYSKSFYTKSINKLTIICPLHGEFNQVASAHWNGQGCSKCFGNTKRTTAEFIEQASIVHNEFYDYSKSVYVSANQKITIICPIHGEFNQPARNHLLGQECRKCCGNDKKTTADFIEMATKKHNGFYDYSKSVCVGTKNKTTIICPIHGDFKQEISSHIAGAGCPKCAGKHRRNTEEFIEEATKKHNGFYEYSKSVYINKNKKITIICPKHGEFNQRAEDHLIGKGCRKCVGNISKMETAWLDSLLVPQEFRQKTIKINGKNFHTDAADIDKKIVWEFYGDFWHGNISMYNQSEINKVTKCTFGKLQEKTLMKENILRDNGYTVINIWESDFIKQLKSLIPKKIDTPEPQNIGGWEDPIETEIHARQMSRP